MTEEEYEMKKGKEPKKKKNQKSERKRERKGERKGNEKRSQWRAHLMARERNSFHLNTNITE